ncbi:hypothetical protein FB451DRAFT_510870 [Mycena latifolia]|nr:hypothetical protein FB451DRAFT_510870 [Mycena latifolia]
MIARRAYNRLSIFSLPHPLKPHLDITMLDNIPQPPTAPDGLAEYAAANADKSKITVDASTVSMTKSFVVEAEQNGSRSVAGSEVGSEKYFSTSEFSADTQHPSVDTTFPENPMDVDPPLPVVSDLMSSVNGMFRVLDLISENGSGGLVNKIIISQDSLKAFINELSPGAYASLTKVDFKTLDELLIKPVGLYGSKSEIVAFLSAQGAVDELTARALCLSRDNSTGPSLRSGLYLLRRFGLEAGKEQIFVIYWPEDTTWDDNAISSIARNRETFMRYLTKICDQVVCFISEEHAQSIVWSDGAEDAGANVENKKPRRVHKFQVAKTNEQEETVTTRLGFTINIPIRFVDSINPALAPKLIGGETRQALLTTDYVPAGLREEALSQDSYNQTQLRNLLLNGAVEFSPDLSDTAIEALISASPGFELRYKKVFENWRSRNAVTARQLDDRFKTQEADMLSRVMIEAEERTDLYRQLLIDRLLDQFPSIPRASLSNASDEEHSNLRNEFSALVRNYPLINAELERILESPKITIITPEKIFRSLKEILIYIKVFLSARQDLSGAQREAAIIELLSSRGFSVPASSRTRSRKTFAYAAGFVSAAAAAATSLASGAASLLWNKKDHDEFIASETSRLVATTSDAQFLTGLRDLLATEPVLGNIISQTIGVATDHLNSLINKFMKTLVGKATQIQQDGLKHQLKHSKAQVLLESSRESLRTLREDMEIQTPSAAVRITAFDAQKPHYGPASYKVQGFKRFSSDAFLNCQVHLLSLTTDDHQMLQMDPLFIPCPRIKMNAAGFLLDPRQRIVHAQLVDRGDLLLVLEDPTHLLVYLETPGRIHEVVSRRRHLKSIVREKIGEAPIISYDESTRMLLICAASKLTLHLFLFDEPYSSLQTASSVNLAEWCAEGATITQACFVSGSEEILVIDSGNEARIYSLLPRQVRPATLSLPERPISAYSSPDGACLLLSYPRESGIAFCAYHWNTFGSSKGIDLGILRVPHSSISLTSMVNRRNIHLVGIDTGVCESVAMDITKKTTEFLFKEAAVKSLPKTKHNSMTHNCLIDCHSDVWARFPVVAAVQRQTIISSKNRLPRSITFSTYSDHNKFAPHFDDLISSFEQRTRKPTGNELQKIRVSAIAMDSATAVLSADNKWAASEFCAGEWLVDLLCLIPIQIAVTQENQFVPLKDGVLSAALEQKLLGAEVGQIVDSLSLGWYESVFQSYMVSKPIKVVSSMGEQSVGKSFCLNHLCDTSFAGSAMRTTEGVWMSVTPTNSALIVALDFEGVHSIERSAQEDTFLVLFNTAISNLVLFRNNFAMSRSITGLFQSFQSSSTVLDPAANPQLFKSTLVIIIKDVVDSDEEGIVREFSTKFQKIVEDEQDANFISRLHAGQLDIIPWPVIESKQFYTLFSTLKQTLDQQEITHPTAGEFLHTLKVLMAKLKAKDWGALSETLAAHRAQKLCTYLNNALEFGFYETEPTREPLKNFDTDSPIDHPDTSLRFFLSASDATHDERKSIMTTLQKSWDQFDARHQTSEVEWAAGLATFLQARAETRIKYVFHWIQSNLARFTSNHANMDLLQRDFESGAVDLRSNVEICRMQCASCNLLCLLRRHHDGGIPHDCQTTHNCPHPCDFGEEHAQPEKCGYPAGHSGKHICVVGVHLCGEPCALRAKNGCMKKCTKIAKHNDEGHMCAARIHACGEPCSLQRLKFPGNRTYTCTQTCAIPSHEVHDHHLCSTQSCPITCELCKRLCANTDHLHGLQPDARHLCGQEHKCSALCTAQGICQIDTAPQSIEATFTGRHETFQYTKYSQDSKRLRCAIMIPPNEREHTGRHIHSTDPNPFHFCETRCLNCGYFCTLPLGHPQQEHETSHGSMSRTTWSIDGPDDTILELNGRKFASNDDGAPMMCSIICRDMGRHVHVDYCRATDDAPCDGLEVQHIDVPLAPNPDQPKDWISHSLFWKRTGFKDPYSRDDQANFGKCDSMCPGPEHTTANPPVPSYCSLPVLHAPQAAGQVVPADPGAQGYLSSDGHLYTCKNPADMPAYHVIFVIDKSSSMRASDFRPLPNRPGADLIIQHSNNRLGAVLSSLHAFWISRSSAADPSRRGVICGRKDAYTLIFFDNHTSTCLENDTTQSPHELLLSALRYSASGGTNFRAALLTAEAAMREHWSDARAPVVIFLSDGECNGAEETVEHIGRTALELGHPLSFQSVLFGTTCGRGRLNRMAEVALEIQNSATNNAAQRSIPSSFSEAPDEVKLAETFLGFAESLRKPRGCLLR